MGWVKVSNIALKYKILAGKFLLSDFFFFEVIKIIQIGLRGLGKLNFSPLSCWVLSLEYCRNIGR